MALIDIVKLNEEIDKMIAIQETEIDRIDEKAHQSNAYRYMQFVTTLETMFEIAKGIGKEIRVNLGVFDSGYGSRHSYWIKFPAHSDGRLYIQYSGKLSPTATVTQATIHLGYGYPDRKDRFSDGWNLIDRVTKWWSENAAEFERNFESACVVALKQKAEAANAKYQAALERQKGAQT